MLFVSLIWPLFNEASNSEQILINSGGRAKGKTSRGKGMEGERSVINN